jgi:hypothetical protein
VFCSPSTRFHRRTYETAASFQQASLVFLQERLNEETARRVQAEAETARLHRLLAREVERRQSLEQLQAVGPCLTPEETPQARQRARTLRQKGLDWDRSPILRNPVLPPGEVGNGSFSPQRGAGQSSPNRGPGLERAGHSPQSSPDRGAGSKSAGPGRSREGGSEAGACRRNGLTQPGEFISTPLQEAPIWREGLAVPRSLDRAFEEVGGGPERTNGHVASGEGLVEKLSQESSNRSGTGLAGRELVPMAGVDRQANGGMREGVPAEGLNGGLNGELRGPLNAGLSGALNGGLREGAREGLGNGEPGGNATGAGERPFPTDAQIRECVRNILAQCNPHQVTVRMVREQAESRLGVSLHNKRRLIADVIDEEAAGGTDDDEDSIATQVLGEERDQEAPGFGGFSGRGIAQGGGAAGQDLGSPEQGGNAGRGGVTFLGSDQAWSGVRQGGVSAHGVVKAEADYSRGNVLQAGAGGYEQGGGFGVSQYRPASPQGANVPRNFGQAYIPQDFGDGRAGVPEGPDVRQGFGGAMASPPWAQEANVQRGFGGSQAGRQENSQGGNVRQVMGGQTGAQLACKCGAGRILELTTKNGKNKGRVRVFVQICYLLERIGDVGCDKEEQFSWPDFHSCFKSPGRDFYLICSLL